MAGIEEPKSALLYSASLLNKTAIAKWPRYHSESMGSSKLYLYYF